MFKVVKIHIGFLKDMNLTEAEEASTAGGRPPSSSSLTQKAEMSGLHPQIIIQFILKTLKNILHALL